MNELFKHLPISWIDATILEHFEEIALKYPQKIALNDGENKLTYHEVLLHTNSISKNIHLSGESKEPVIILLENNVFFICAMLACLAEGRGYIPLDFGFAYERNKQIISHCQSRVIISKSSLVRKYNLDTTFQLIELNSQLTESPTHNYQSTPDDLAYILYTSGSTGQPKGVFQNQRNLLHDVMQYINVAEITAEDNLSLLYSPSVSGAIRDIYGALLTGATLYINNLQKHGVASIPNFIEENKLTIYHSIPSIFRTGLTCQTLPSFNTVRLIYLAGDKIFKQDVDLYKHFFSDACKLYVGIGSTENATIYRQWFIDKQTNISSGIVPVGYAVDDRVMTLVDADGNEVENELLGEIHVRSKYCALGYWKDELLTQKHFILHKDGSRTVKTGDWGRINSEGLLEFKGRRDGQVKINGFRVETGEVEASIRATKGVVDAAVLIRNEEGNNKIAAYVLLEEHVTLEEIKLKLNEILSSHMFPSFFFAVDKIPYLSNFKIDYQALQNIDKEKALEDKTSKHNVLKPEKEILENKSHLYIKERMLSLWCKYASYESFRDDETWKSGGGSSLEAVSFILSIEQEFGVEFPNSLLYENLKPSVIESQIKQFLGKETRSSKEDTEESVHVYVFPSLRGITPETREFLRELNKNAPLTLIDYPNLEEWKKEDICLENIANAIDKRVFEKGKQKVFIGYCHGDHIAFYLLNQLEVLYPNLLNFFIMDTPVISNYNFNVRFSQNLKQHGFWKTCNLYFKTIITRIRGRFITKSHNLFAQRKVRAERYPFKPMEIKAHLLISSKNSFRKDDLGWRYFLPNMTSEMFAFTHSEMFRDKQSKKVVLEKLLDFIEEVKEK
jgi:fengycin family lipopeptide synthetase E